MKRGGGMRVVWYDTKVKAELMKVVKKRLLLAAEYLKNKIKRNLSVPVVGVRRRRRRTTSRGPAGSTYTYILPESRSKPGEFPRAEKSRLLRDIFTRWDEGGDGGQAIIATSLFYGYLHEVWTNRSFLLRSYYAEKATIRAIIVPPGGGNESPVVQFRK